MTAFDVTQGLDDGGRGAPGTVIVIRSGTGTVHLEVGFGGPGGIRTPNQGIMSPLL